MSKHILVATDGSELAGKAVHYALDLAKTMKAKLTVVNVSESWSPLDIANKVQAGHLKAISDFEKQASDNAMLIFRDVINTGQGAGVTIHTKHVADSRPADGILQAAKDENCDLIVMSSHGRRGISEMFLGSQAHEVLSRSKIPVLICK